MKKHLEGATDLSLFPNGAGWVRVDFHLHTAADSQFIYDGDPKFYNSAYVDALRDAEIRLAVITNHNKFDLAEFKSLRATARGKEIALLPGVELSVDDGANGVHTLVVFSDEWLAAKTTSIHSLGWHSRGKRLLNTRTKTGGVRSRSEKRSKSSKGTSETSS